jgi:hypothetical protein
MNHSGSGSLSIARQVFESSPCLRLRISDTSKKEPTC